MRARFGVCASLLIRAIRCDKGVKFGGIVYLHDITQCQPHIANPVNPTTLSPAVVSSVVLATGKWGQGRVEAQQRREEQLKEHCCTLVDGELQPKVARFTNEKDSAWSIVDSLLMKHVELCVIQGELNKILDRLSQQSKPKNRWHGFFSHFSALLRVSPLTWSFTR